MATLTYEESPRQRPGAARRLSAFFARLVAARRERRDLEKLRGASDRVLGDIGIARSELDRALASPIWTNPADRLLRRW